MIKRCAVALALFMVLGVAGEFAYRKYLRRRCLSMAPEHAESLFELYAVGESTPAGEPYTREIAFPMLAGKMFGYKIAGKEAMVANLAKHGESMYPQYIALRRELCCRNAGNPGAVFIYSGNNDDHDPKWRYSPLEHLKRKMLLPSMLLQDIFYFLERAGFIFYRRNFQNYEHYLRRTIELSKKRGLIPILSTVVSNTADFDPALLPGPGMPPAAQVRALIGRGEELESRRKYKEALAYYRRAADTLPALGLYLRYRIGKCRQALGDYAAAKKDFAACVDSNVGDNFGRSTTRQNELLRRLAEEYQVPLVDAVEIFARNSPHGLIGNELLADGHHPNIQGHVLLAQAFAQALSAAYNEKPKAPIAYSDDIFFTLSYSKADQAAAFLDSGGWLLSSAAGHLYPRPRLRLAEARFKSALDLYPDNFSAWLGLGLIDAARRGDFLLKRENIEWLERNVVAFGPIDPISPKKIPGIMKKLKDNGVPESLRSKITACFERAREEEIFKRHNDAVVQFKVASILFQNGRVEKAVPFYRRAVEINPDYAQAYADLGYALMTQGRWAQAIEQYHRALAVKPEDYWMRTNMGIAFAAQYQWAKAIEQYRKVLAFNPKDEEAKENLAVALEQLSHGSPQR